MDKKTKLLLGAGIVAVGAYLLLKSKKASPALTASAPANLVGFDTGKFYDVKGGHAGVKNEGVFADAVSKKEDKKSFANQPFNFAGAGVVGKKTVPFAEARGDRQVSADGRASSFFKPETVKVGKDDGVFRKKTPVMPSLPVPVRQDKPVNNFASLQGGSMINSFSVKDGFKG